MIQYERLAKGRADLRDSRVTIPRPAAADEPVARERVWRAVGVLCGGVRALIKAGSSRHSWRRGYQPEIGDLEAVEGLRLTADGYT